MSKRQCKCCGACCVNNGLIPPLLYGVDGDTDEADRPEWLKLLVDRLRLHFGDVAEHYPCVFLTDDFRCAIHDIKPDACRQFECEE